jgi:hypothetical protein
VSPVNGRFRVNSAKEPTPEASISTTTGSQPGGDRANTRVHSETQETPIARFLSQGPPAADPALMVEALRWSALRVVSKTASISLAGNRYAVDPTLVGLS